MSIEAVQVTRYFGQAAAVWQLDLSVPSGSVTGLVGPNGAGKTTLLLMLAGLLRPDSGSIRVAGLDPVAQPRQVHQAVGWMPDAFGTWDSLTCSEILETFAVAQDVERSTIMDRVQEMLRTVHLADMAGAPARVLSRGQKQRLGLARALVHRPQVLLLDEPASGMDPRSRADLRVLLRELAGAGVTVLISSHILGELEEMVDHVAFVSRGRTVHGVVSGADDAGDAGDADAETAEVPAGAAGRPRPVRTAWRMRALDGDLLADWLRGSELAGVVEEPGAVRLELANDRAAAQALRQAVEAGVEVMAFGPVTGTLEETYLAMEEERR